MKMKKGKTKFWKGVPDELRYMCLANIRSSAKSYCIAPALEYLGDHLLDCDYYVFGTTPYDIIKWIDIVFETCLFPLEVHEEVWRANSDAIWRILNRSEELLNKYAPSDYKQGCRTSFENIQEFNAVEYAQKLNVYFCVLFMITEDWKRLFPYLENVVSDSERNVDNMILYEDAMKYVNSDDWAEYHYVGVDKWEPINWLYRESLPNDKAQKMYAQAYEEYAIFLFEKCSTDADSQAQIGLHRKAEERLLRLCNYFVDEETCNARDRKRFEKMIERSEKRLSQDLDLDS